MDNHGHLTSVESGKRTEKSLSPFHLGRQSRNRHCPPGRKKPVPCLPFCNSTDDSSCGLCGGAFLPRCRGSWKAYIHNVRACHKDLNWPVQSGACSQGSITKQFGSTSVQVGHPPLRQRNTEGVPPYLLDRSSSCFLPEFLTIRATDRNEGVYKYQLARENAL